jgi:ribosomal protein L25 (general stress protein Ctc)
MKREAQTRSSRLVENEERKGKSQYSMYSLPSERNFDARRTYSYKKIGGWQRKNDNNTQHITKVTTMTPLRPSVMMPRLTLAKRRLTAQFRNFSSNKGANTSEIGDVTKVVSGLSQEDVDSNPQIAEFLEANFGSHSDTLDDGFLIPDKILQQFGVSQSDFPAAKKGSNKEYGAPKLDRGLGTEEQQALNIRTLHTFLRQEEGSNSCRRLRYDKIIPGILYGSDPNSGMLSINNESRTMLKTPWPELQRELDRFHRRFESRVYDLTVYEDEGDTEGTVHRVVPRNVQRHPVQGSVYCANFLRYFPGRPLKIPIVHINTEESPALKRDGFIIPVSKYIECIVEDGVAIPDAIELECTGVKLKEVLRMDRLIFPDGVRPTDRIDAENFVVGPVVGGRGGSSEEDDEDAEEEISE